MVVSSKSLVYIERKTSKQINRVYNEEYNNKNVNKEHRGEVSNYLGWLMMCTKTR